MATVGSRLTSSGVLSIAGEFDEVTRPSLGLTLANQFATEFDEITLQPSSSSLNLTTNIGQVFVGPFGGGGTGIPNVPVELGYSYSGNTGFPTAIVNDQVPVGSRVYVQWTYDAYVGSTENALVDMGVVSAVYKSGAQSYVMVSNPYGVKRPFYAPDPVSGFINSNIVAYGATRVLISYASGVGTTKRETSTGSLMVSGYFDEVNKPT